jgi:hypothetical protein
MSNIDNDTPKPAESGPLDLAEIETRLKAATPNIADMTRVAKGATVCLNYILDDGYNPILAPEAQKFIDHAPTDIAALVQEVKRLRAELAEINKPPMQRIKERIDAKAEGRRKFREENPDYDPVEALSHLLDDIDPEIIRTCLYGEEE